MAMKLYSDTDIQAIANAIRTKNGSSDTYTVSEMAQAITEIPAGGGGGTDEEEPLKDVVFIDYDGSIVQQYTKEEFLSLTDMPANPSHTGLTAQGWNWTLADAKAYVTEYDYLCIGQSYITNDGKTRIYFNVNDLNINREFELRFYTSVKGGATIDWGDGTTLVTTANAGSVGYYKHTFTTKGEYLITITVTSGVISLGYNGASGTFFGQGDLPRIVATGVKKIELGSNIANILRQAFPLACYLESITIPKGVYFSSGGNGTQFCSIKMQGLVIPKGITAVGPLGDMHNLRMLSLPKELTTVHASPLLAGRSTDQLRIFTFANSAISTKITIIQYGGTNLEKFRYTGNSTIYGDTLSNNGTFFGYVNTDIVVPSYVTEISDYAFTGTIPLKHYHIKATTPPTLANARAFGRIADFTKIYVPYSADHSILEAYKATTNWSSLTAFLEEEPQ